MNFEKEWDTLLNASSELTKGDERRKEYFTIYMNSSLFTEEGKNEVGKIPMLGLQISNFIRENKIDLVDVIIRNDNFTEVQKEILLNYSKDLEYLFPIGGSFFDLEKFPRFDKKTRETIKIWISLLSILGGGVLGAQNLYINALEIQEKKINLKVLENESELNDIELKQKMIELELLENQILEINRIMLYDGNADNLPPTK